MKYISTWGAAHRNVYRYVLGLFALFTLSFFFSDSAYASVVAPTSAAVTTSSTSTLGLSWAWGGGTETQYDVEESQSDCTGSFAPITTILSTTTLTYTATGLSPDIQYCFRVAATNNGLATSSYSTTSYHFTLATTPLQPTVSVLGDTSLQITIPSDGNSTNGALSSLYSIQELGSSLWDGYPNGGLLGFEEFTSAAAWNSSHLTGLTPNSAYSFRTRVGQRAGGNTAYSPTSAVTYTLASVPSSITPSISTSSLALSWVGNGNSYIVSNDTLSQSTSTATTSYSLAGLSCGTTYAFRIASINHSGATSSYSTTVNAGTYGCMGGLGSSHFYTYLPGNGGTVARIASVQNFGSGSTQPMVTNYRLSSSVPLTSSTSSNSTTSPIMHVTYVTSVDSSSAATSTQPKTPLPQVVAVATATSNVSFTKNLHVGNVDSDVILLQQFLNSHGFSVASEGSGSPGNESAYFGSLTKSALIKYQQAHGISPAKGYFGPMTRASVNGQ